MGWVELEKQAPEGLDLGEATHLAAVDALTDAILDELPDMAAIEELEAERREREEPTPLAMSLAIKVAKSRRFVASFEGPAKLSVVFAVYKEHNRLRSRDEHPHGEDALVRKMAQLDRLIAGRPNWSWEILVVDDGCPEGSGRIAAEIIEREGRQDQARVLFLEEGIASGSPGVGALKSANDSRKGGSIHYGMWTAAEEPAPGQIVIFTDADLSTHLGQCGSLAAPILTGRSPVSIGSRREADSVVVKAGGRNDRGKLFIYLWKQILGPLNGVTDTQCGFKAFDATKVRQWVERGIEKGFAFDIELLLQARALGDDAIARVAVAWIDSEAASTTTDLQPYLPMLQSVAAMYRHHLPGRPMSDGFADFVTGLGEEAWQHLLTKIPTALTDREPSEFDGETELVSAAELAELAG